MIGREWEGRERAPVEESVFVQRVVVFGTTGSFLRP